MADMTDGYPFIFQMNDRSNADDELEYTLQYVLKHDEKASFFFIGANDEKDELLMLTSSLSVSHWS